MFPIKTKDDIRAVVITGNGDNFCAGGDITSMENMTDKQALERLHDVRDTAMAITGCTRPVIAAIKGHTAGIGLGLLCDAVITSKAARVTLSFSRIGLGPDWGLTAAAFVDATKLQPIPPDNIRSRIEHYSALGDHTK